MAGPQFVFVMKGLSKTYPGGKQVLKDIWLSFYPGAKIGIIGVNGSGKSTLLRIMAGGDKEVTGRGRGACASASSHRSRSLIRPWTCAAMSWPASRRNRRCSTVTTKLLQIIPTR